MPETDPANLTGFDALNIVGQVIENHNFKPSEYRLVQAAVATLQDIVQRDARGQLDAGVLDVTHQPVEDGDTAKPTEKIDSRGKKAPAKKALAKKAAKKVAKATKRRR